MQREDNSLVRLRVKSIGIEPNDLCIFWTSVCSLFIVSFDALCNIRTLVSNILIYQIFCHLKRKSLIKTVLDFSGPSSGLKSVQQYGHLYVFIVL